MYLYKKNKTFIHNENGKIPKVYGILEMLKSKSFMQ